MDSTLAVAFCLSSALILAFMLIGRLLSSFRSWVITKTGAWVIWVTFIGVIHHELAHFLLALLTGAKIQSVVLFRLKAKDGNIGEVSFTPRGWNVAQSMQVVLSSVAPMLLGFISLLVLFVVVNPIVTGIWQIVLYYVEFSILLNMSLSKQDVKNILTRIGWLMIVLTSLIWVYLELTGYVLPSGLGRTAIAFI